MHERSRAPHRIPHKTLPEVEQAVLQARDCIPCFGPRRLQQEFGFDCPTGAIGRILRQHGRSTYNSDLKTVHGLMEPEFYELERFNGSVRAFPNQAYSYQLYFNLVRGNSGKGGQTPEQLRQIRAPTVSPQIHFLPPVMLSSLEAQDLPLPRQVLAGHDVPGYVRFR